MTSDLARIRTSLQRAPSGMTEAQQQARTAAYERELWRRKGAVVVRLDDREYGFVADAIGTARFGKREVKDFRVYRGG